MVRAFRARRWLALAAVPAITALAFAIGPSLPVVLGLVVVQVALLMWSLAPLPTEELSTGGHPPVTERAQLEQRLSAIPPGSQTAALAVCLDESEHLTKRHGGRFVRALLADLGQRLAWSLREQDGYCQLGPTSFGVILAPQRGIDLGSVLAVAQRIQTRLAQPFTFEGVTAWPSASIGFCLGQRAAALNGLGLLDAAERATAKAVASGPGGLNSYSVVDFPASVSGEKQATLRRAIETGEIVPYFQPQVRTTTGEISGLEALARWHHPQRDLIQPAEFLPQIEAAGLSALLAEHMLRRAIATLARLDAQGQHVPSVSVNLSSQELRNPRLADEIAWELDRHNLTPDRLTLEILETVVADGDDDVAVRTIARLSGMGCGIDLDDFGTGHASIANIRRFAVDRIKIDRSFVARLNEDRDQARMVAAILSMAEQLDLKTVAEGVEYPEEQIMLAQMGCHHLQGFAIARPMAAEPLVAWLEAHAEALRCGEPWCEDPPQARAASDGG